MPSDEKAPLPYTAVFWDAENVTLNDEESIAEEFQNWLNVNYDATERFAFADWNGPYRDLGRLLYRIGFDLIHVPDDLKDASDCQMAAYIVDWLVRSPETESYLIVSGDAVFEPFVKALKKQGKTVIVVSDPMITRPETVIRSDFYVDISSFKRKSPSKFLADEESEASPNEVRQVAFRRLRETISRIRKMNKSTFIRYVEAVAEHLNPGLQIGQPGFDRWDQVISKALADGIVALEGSDPYPELVLTDKVAKESATQSDAIENAMEQFRYIVDAMCERGEHTGMESVVQRVRDAGIDFKELGYSKFGDFARAAESRDIIRIVEQKNRPPEIKPNYTMDIMLDWYKQNTKKYFSSSAKVPRDRFIRRTIQFLHKYDVSIIEMEKYLNNSKIQKTYHDILETSGLSFIPPYEQILLSILLGKGWSCKDAVEVVNRELVPLGYAIECP